MADVDDRGIPDPRAEKPAEESYSRYKAPPSLQTGHGDQLDPYKVLGPEDAMKFKMK